MVGVTHGNTWVDNIHAFPAQTQPLNPWKSKLKEAEYGKQMEKMFEISVWYNKWNIIIHCVNKDNIESVYSVVEHAPVEAYPKWLPLMW